MKQTIVTFLPNISKNNGLDYEINGHSIYRLSGFQADFLPEFLSPSDPGYLLGENALGTLAGMSTCAAFHQY